MTLSVHICVQHDVREAARRAGPSATADTCCIRRSAASSHEKKKQHTERATRNHVPPTGQWSGVGHIDRLSASICRPQFVKIGRRPSREIPGDVSFRVRLAHPSASGNHGRRGRNGCAGNPSRTCAATVGRMAVFHCLRPTATILGYNAAAAAHKHTGCTPSSSYVMWCLFFDSTTVAKILLTAKQQALALDGQWNY